MEKQKLRSEADKKYTWDLSTIFKSEKEFLKEIELVKKEIKKITKYENTMMDSANNLYLTLDLDNNLSYKIEKIYLYAHLKLDEDTTNQRSQKNYGIVQNLWDEYTKLSSYIIPTLMKYELKDIKKFFKENNKLKEEFSIALERIFRQKKYHLSEKEEKLLSKLNKALDNSSEVYSALVDADMTFDSIKLLEGKEVELTESNYGIYIASKSRKVRKQAYDSLYKSYKNHSNSLSKTLSNFVESNVCLSKIRGYSSSLDESLFSDNISDKVYNNLINIVSKNLKPLFKYYKLKKKMLKLDDLYIYDIYVPVLNEYEKEYSFEDAKELVLNALSILGEDYISNLNKAFNERWIDVYSNKGKRSGAYSSGMYKTNPFLLLNFEGKFKDVSTLAHELGHSMHTYYSCKNNKYQYSSYRIFVAEVASLVNELLLANYMLKNSKDKKEKISILNELMELYKSTLYRQTMFAEFEKHIYDLVEKGDILTSELICNEYYKINQKYFGDVVKLDENIKYECLRIPHFYYFFYVYKYATGISAATFIAREILKGNEEVKQNYLKFLTLGDSKFPLEELKVAGVDLEDPKVIKDAIKYFEEILEEFEKLVK